MISEKTASIAHDWNKSTALDKCVCILFLIFPLFTNLISSWTSSIFVILGLCSLFYIKKGWANVDSLQRFLAFSLVFFFTVYAIKATMLGWQEPEIKALGVEIRFLFVIPLLCLCAYLPQARFFLILGSFLGLVVFLCQAGYEVGLHNKWRLEGIYNPLRVAALALVFTFVVGSYFFYNKQYKRLFFVFILGGGVVYFTHGRMAMIAFVCIALSLVFIWLKSWKLKFLVGLIVLLSSFFVYMQSSVLQDRFSEFKVLKNYIDKVENYDDKQPGSWVTHFMMLEASWSIFKDEPILGVGRRHYLEHVQSKVEKEGFNPVLSNPNFNSPHTLIAEVAVSKGTLGLLALALYFLSGLLIALRSGRNNTMMFSFISIVFLTGVAEAIWVIKGGFVAVLVVYSAVLSSAPKSEEKVLL